MKKITYFQYQVVFLTLFFCIWDQPIFSQVPQAISYQAVARNTSGNLLANQSIRVRLTIHQGTPTGTTQYQETHNPTTNVFGLFSVLIGQGTPVIGTFGSVTWNDGIAKYLQTEMDPAGGTSYINMGTSKLQSVQYSLVSGTSQGLQSKGVSVVVPSSGQVLKYDGSQWAPGNISGSAWSLAGNSGTNPASNFLGTTDNKALKFRVNNVVSGEINPSTSNIFFGKSAGQMNTTGYSNVALGGAALFSNTGAHNLVAIGDSALYHQTADVSKNFGNTAIGSKSLYANTTGYENTAIGKRSLFDNVSGFHNTSIGTYSLYHNTSGYDNIAIGYESMYQNLNGQSNTSMGAYSLFSNTSGAMNCAYGYGTMYYNTTGYSNTAFGADALYNNLSGINNVALGFALFNNTTGSFNTGIGSGALLNNTLGHSNVALGACALHSNTVGNNHVAIGDSALYHEQITYPSIDYINVAIGSKAMFNTVYAGQNVAVGAYALYSNDNGSQNTSIGDHSLYSSTAGVMNTAVGSQSLYSVTTGEENTGVGVSSLYYNTWGYNNTAIGSYSMWYNNTGIANAAMGSNSLYSNTDGANNTAVGSSALYNAIHGNSNTAVGSGALLNCVSSSNTALGKDALTTITSGTYNTGLGRATGSTSGCFNSTVIGDAAVVNSSNKVRIGDVGISVIEGQVAWSYPSDGRFKSDVSDDVKGLEFIKLLHPVTYYFDTRKYTDFLTRNMPDSLRSKYQEKQDKTKTNPVRQSGFVAQEVVEAARAAGYQFDGVHIPVDENDNYSVAYSQFVVPLVKAVQEQQEIIEKLEKRVEELEAEINK